MSILQKNLFFNSFFSIKFIKAFLFFLFLFIAPLAQLPLDGSIEIESFENKRTYTPAVEGLIRWLVEMRLPLLFFASVFSIFIVIRNSLKISRLSPLVRCLILLQLVFAFKLLAYEQYEPAIKYALNAIILFSLALVFDYFVLRTTALEIRKILGFSLLFILAITFPEIISAGTFISESRDQFFYLNPNQAGTSIATLLMLYTTFLKENKLRSYIFPTLIILLSLYLVFLTGSRASFSALLIFFILQLGRIKLVTIFISLFVISIYLGFAISDNRDNRFTTWLRFLYENEFNFIYGINYQYAQTVYVESFFVTLLISLGLIGFSLLIFFLRYYLIIIKNCIKIHKKLIINFSPFFISFLWINLFESLFIGVFSVPMLLFILALSLLKKYNFQIKDLINRKQ